jgi:hypothetical protein
MKRNAFPRTANRGVVAALALTLMSLATAAEATTCYATAFEFYQHAYKAGWRFTCQTSTIAAGNPAFIPKPTGEISCVGSHPFRISVDLFVRRPPRLAFSTSEPRQIAHGWSFDGFERSYNVGMRFVGRDIRFSRWYNGGKYELSLRKVSFSKSGGSCSRLWAEAF